MCARANSDTEKADHVSFFGGVHSSTRFCRDPICTLCINFVIRTLNRRFRKRVFLINQLQLSSLAWVINLKKLLIFILKTWMFS